MIGEGEPMKMRMALMSVALLAALPVQAEPPVAGEPPQSPDVECEPPPARVRPNPSKTYPADYPSMSIRNREQGEVALSMCINAKGEVSNVKVTKSSGFPRLDEASLKQVARLQFLPALDACGKPVAWCDPPYTMTMNWRLPGL